MTVIDSVIDESALCLSRAIDVIAASDASNMACKRMSLTLAKTKAMTLVTKGREHEDTITYE